MQVSELLARALDRLKPGNWRKNTLYRDGRACAMGHIDLAFLELSGVNVRRLDRSAKGDRVHNVQYQDHAPVVQAQDLVAEVMKEQFMDRLNGGDGCQCDECLEVLGYMDVEETIARVNDHKDTKVADIQLALEKAMIRASEQGL